MLIDLKLPTINGLETYLAIREIASESVTVMMTAYRRQCTDLLDIARQHDVFACIYKPLDIEELLGVLAQALHKKPNGW